MICKHFRHWRSNDQYIPGQKAIQTSDDKGNPNIRCQQDTWQWFTNATTATGGWQQQRRMPRRRKGKQGRGGEKGEKGKARKARKARKDEMEEDASSFPYPVVYDTFVTDFNNIVDKENNPESIKYEEFKEVWDNYIIGEENNKEINWSMLNYTQIPSTPILPIVKRQLYIEGINEAFGNLGLGSTPAKSRSRTFCDDDDNQNHIMGWNYLFGTSDDSPEKVLNKQKFSNHLIWKGITPEDKSCFFNDNYSNMMRLCINQIKTCIELQSVVLKSKIITIRPPIN